MLVFVGSFLHKLGEAMRLNEIEELDSRGVFLVIEVEVEVACYYQVTRVCCQDFEKG